MNLARSLGSVGGLTLVSRILALVRDTLQASYVGASFASDAFFVAFRLPNMFRALFAEGAFNAAFIPMFNRKVGEADDLNAGLKFAEQTLAVLSEKLPERYAVEINSLMVPFGKNVCTPIGPKCSICPLLDMCEQRGVTSYR